MSLNSAGITAGMAAMSVSGVTVKDAGAVPAVVTSRDTPILFPQLDQAVTGGTSGPSTFGTAGTRMWQFERTFRYQYLHCVAGAVRVPADIAAAMLAKQDLILEAVAELDITGIDVMSVTCPAFGVFGDQAESEKFFGFTLDVQFREKVNA